MKAGDKVVWNGRRSNSVPMRLPVPFDEVLTINDILMDELCEINGYMVSMDGRQIAFPIKDLIPIDYWQQAEYMTEELIQETLMPVEI